jgi:hypothetical protein
MLTFSRPYKRWVVPSPHSFPVGMQVAQSILNGWSRHTGTEFSVISRWWHHTGKLYVPWVIWAAFSPNLGSSRDFCEEKESSLTYDGPRRIARVNISEWRQFWGNHCLSKRKNGWQKRLSSPPTPPSIFFFLVLEIKLRACTCILGTCYTTKLHQRILFTRCLSTDCIVLLLLGHGYYNISDPSSSHVTLTQLLKPNANQVLLPKWASVSSWSG